MNCEIQKKRLVKADRLLSDAKELLEHSIPPRGGTTWKMIQRIKRYLSQETKHGASNARKPATDLRDDSGENGGRI